MSQIHGRTPSSSMNCGGNSGGVTVVMSKDSVSDGIDGRYIYIRRETKKTHLRSRSLRYSLSTNLPLSSNSGASVPIPLVPNGPIMDCGLAGMSQSMMSHTSTPRYSPSESDDL